MPGKSEESLLLAFEPECRLWLWGDDRQGIAYIQADLFGSEGHAGFPALTEAIARAFTQVLDIPPGNVFVRYGDIAAWGMGGQYIDRSWFR